MPTMRPSAHDEPADDGEALPPSKTRRKADMHALQELGERMAALPADKLARLELPEVLRIAILDYRRFNKWEAKRRQMQYIGRLMREIDPAPLTALMDAWEGTTRAAVAGFHAAESWREKLLAEAAALDAFIAAHPRANRARLASLVDQARAERAAGRPPAVFRQLFREVARQIEAATFTAAASPDAPAGPATAANAATGKVPDADTPPSTESDPTP